MLAAAAAKSLQSCLTLRGGYHNWDNSPPAGTHTFSTWSWFSCLAQLCGLHLVLIIVSRGPQWGKKKGLRVNNEPSVHRAHRTHCSASPSGPKLPSEACWQRCPSCHRSSWFPSRWGHRWYGGRTVGSQIGHPPKVNLSRTSVFTFCTHGALDWTGHLIHHPTFRKSSLHPAMPKAYLHTLAFDTPCERGRRECFPYIGKNSNLPTSWKLFNSFPT